MEVLQFKKLNEDAIAPSRATPRSAGIDIYSPKSVIIPANCRVLLETGISVKPPAGHYCRLASRSGMAFVHGILVTAGVIDEDYRGNLSLVLFNFSDKDYAVCKGDRVAQMVVEKRSNCTVEQIEELDETDRGHGGFGSTGK